MTSFIRAAESYPGLQISGFDVAASMLTVLAQQYGMIEAGAGTPRQARRSPMADKSNDPVAMWQSLIGEMEKGFNAFANQAMASPEFSKVVNQVGDVSAGAQKQLGDLMEKYLVSMNLPSRAQMVSMSERLQGIEAQLNEIKALLHQMRANPGAKESGSSGASKPPRAKRPPAAGGEQK
jgi:hypothetical protein